MIFVMLCFSIKTLPPLAFENLNSLETLNLQNNKLTFFAEEPIEPILDTLRVIDVSGMPAFHDVLLLDEIHFVILALHLQIIL